MCLLSGGVMGRTKNYLLSGPMAQVCEAHPPLRRNLGIHSCYVSSVEQKTEQDAKGFKACLVCVCVFACGRKIVTNQYRWPNFWSVSDFHIDRGERSFAWTFFSIYSMCAGI